jgi:hypothetical protein
LKIAEIHGRATDGEIFDGPNADDGGGMDRVLAVRDGGDALEDCDVRFGFEGAVRDRLSGCKDSARESFSPAYREPLLEFFSSGTLGFMLDGPNETAGQRAHRIDQALANSARLETAEVAWQVRSRIRNSMLDLQSAIVTRKLLARQRAGRRPLHD